MKIITYNVNGLRAAASKGLPNWLEQESPDVLCLQETKLQPDQYPASEFEALGYKAYLFSAEKKGYSGVAILTRREPTTWSMAWDWRSTTAKGVSSVPTLATCRLSACTTLRVPVAMSGKILR